MLISVLVMVASGWILGAFCRRYRLPALVGYLLAGILCGPSVGNWVSADLLKVSDQLRQMALVIILTRAGLSLDFRSLKKVGRSAFYLCFLPASFEIVGALLLGGWLLGLSLPQSLLLGTILAAVSPAVVVPRMVRLIEEGYGSKERIPQMILAGASVDDVYVLVLFSSFLTLNLQGSFEPLALLQIPVAILLGLVVGGTVGKVTVRLLDLLVKFRGLRVLLVFLVSYGVLTLEDALSVSYSGLLAIIIFNMVIYQERPPVAQKLSRSFNQWWKGAELVLFFLVGASVNVRFAGKAGLLSVIFIAGLLIFRSVGVFLSLMGSPLSKSQRHFVVMAYLPKATVQAAIGGLPLALGVAQGEWMLTVSVWAILTTAPFGALLIDYFAPRLLTKDSFKRKDPEY